MTAAVSTIDGLVAWANPTSGLRVYGGSKLKVRNSILLANGASGGFLTAYDNTTAGNDLSQVDLGTVADPGHNTLQALIGSNPDVTGVCVSMSGSMGALTLHAAGNVWAGPVDCSTTTISKLACSWASSAASNSASAPSRLYERTTTDTRGAQAWPVDSIQY